mgnify:CR=1 FL=1
MRMESDKPNKRMKKKGIKFLRKVKIYFHRVVDILILKKRELRPWQIKLHEIIFMQDCAVFWFNSQNQNLDSQL